MLAVAHIAPHGERLFRAVAAELHIAHHAADHAVVRGGHGVYRVEVEQGQRGDVDLALISGRYAFREQLV